MLLNCGVGEDSWESFGLQGDPTLHPKMSILKEISPEYSLEGLMLKMKLQYFGHLMQRADSFEKTLMLGKIQGRRKGNHRGWDGWMASPSQWTWVWVNSGIWWWTERPGCSPRGCKESDTAEWQNWLTNWCWYFYWLVDCLIYTTSQCHWS